MVSKSKGEERKSEAKKFGTVRINIAEMLSQSCEAFFLPRSTVTCVYGKQRRQNTLTFPPCGAQVPELLDETEVHERKLYTSVSDTLPDQDGGQAIKK